MSTRDTYRPDIDGLRAVAIVPVVAFHAFPALIRGGFVGVDIFFVISGYLITRIIGAECERRSFSYAGFYARRIRRIFPALLTILVVALLLGWTVLFEDEFSRLGDHVLWSAAFIQNIKLQQEVGYFDISSDSKPLLHIWSLGVEEQFYILWPILLALVWNRGKATVHVAISLLVLASLAVSQFWTSAHPMAAFYSSVSRLWELGIGGQLAVAELQDLQIVPSKLAGTLLGFVGAALLCFAFFFFDQQTRFPGLWALVPVLGTAFLILAGGRSWINKHILSSPPAVWIGRISYPLYLWHWLLLAFLRIVFPAPSLTRTDIVVLMSIVLAWATYRFIETPLKTGRMRTFAVPCLSLAMIAVAGLGFLVGHRDAFAPRLSAVGIDPKAFMAARQENDSCKKLLGLPVAAEEVCRTNSSHPGILIAGDSHAISLASAATIARTKLDTILIAGHGCYMFRNVVQVPVFRQSWANNCPAVVDEVVRAAKTVDSIKTIVIATFGTANDDYDRNATIAKGQHRRDEAYVYRSASGRPIHYREAFFDGYRALLTELEKTGKRIVFVLDVPFFDTDPHDCISRMPFMAARNCDLPRSQVDQSQRAYREMVAQLAGEFPNVRIFDATRALCSDQTCPVRNDHGYLFYDRHHLTVSGSKLVLQKLFGKE